MTATTAPHVAPARRPGYDADAAATAHRVLPMLETERVAWLSTVQPDGRPHLVPAWFWWDGEALLVWSKPGAVKVRNLRADPRLMLAVGDAGADFSVGLVEARAELVEAAVPAGFFAKYAADLAAGDLDEAAFRATYAQAIRIVPSRLLSWRGRGARHAAGPARGPRPPGGIAGRVAALLALASARLRIAATAPSPA
jgi:PPOX class probable F420-dependent enzyme